MKLIKPKFEERLILRFSYIIYILYHYYLVMVTLPGFWDFPVYAIYLNKMDSLFSSFLPIQNSLLYTYWFFIKIVFNISSMETIKLGTFLLSIVNLIYFNKLTRQISTIMKKNIYLLYFLSFYIFSPLYIQLICSSKQYFLTTILIILIYHIQQISHISTLKSNLMNSIKFGILILIGNLISVLSLFTNFSLVFIYFTRIDKLQHGKKKLKFLLILIPTFANLLGDIFAVNFFLNNSIIYIDQLSPFTYSIIMPLYNLGLKYLLTLNQNSLLFMSAIFYSVLYFFIYLFVLLVYKYYNHDLIPTHYFNSLLFFILVMSSIFLGDQRSEVFYGYPFSLFFIWGGFLTIFVYLWSNIYLKIKLREINHIQIYLNSLLMISILIIIFNNLITTNVFNSQNPNFPVYRLYYFLIFPIAAIVSYDFTYNLDNFSIKSIISMSLSYSFFFISAIISYINSFGNEINLLNLFQIINQLDNIILFLTWVIIIIVMKLNYRINFNLKFPKNIKLRHIFHLLLTIQIIVSIIIALSVPPTIYETEINFISEIDNNLPFNSYIATGTHQNYWLEHLSSKNLNILKLDAYSPFINKSYQPTILLLLDFINTPTMQLLNLILDTLNISKIYLWISHNPRYSQYAPFNLDNLYEFTPPISIDPQSYNYLFEFQNKDLNKAQSVNQ